MATHLGLCDQHMDLYVKEHDQLAKFSLENADVVQRVTSELSSTPEKAHAALYSCLLPAAVARLESDGHHTEATALKRLVGSYFALFNPCPWEVYAGVLFALLVNILESMDPVTAFSLIMLLAPSAVLVWAVANRVKILMFAAAGASACAGIGAVVSFFVPVAAPLAIGAGCAIGAGIGAGISYFF